MKPQNQLAKKSSSTTISSTPNKVLVGSKPTTKKSTLSNDDEKAKPVLPRKVGQLIPTNKISNARSTKTSAPKLSISQPKNVGVGITSRTSKLTQVAQKQTQPSKVKQVTRPKELPATRPPSSKPNLVMSSVHNVTVSSPPSKRKEITAEPITTEKEPRIRSKSRTLNPEEIVILKAKATEQNSPLEGIPLKIKEPVAFEVVFDESHKPTAAEKDNKIKSPAPSDSGPDYEDDFESYESDFETGSSSEVISESSSSSKSSSTDDRESPPYKNENDVEDKSEGEEESELTHIPITVIHREKELERKLDSGNYDLNSKRRRAIESFDSLDTLANSEQLDSGISYENSISATAFDPGSVSKGGYSEFYTRPKITKRGIELMSKIQFDQISFTLLDLKPIPYEIFMRMFGGSNSMQAATQTLEDRMESECQTDGDEQRSVWTQHPPQYDLLTIQGTSGISNCTGEFFNEVNNEATEDIFEKSIQALSQLRQNTPPSGGVGHTKPINFELLNAFLNSSSSIISRILLKDSPELRLDTTDLPKQSRGFFKLNTSFLNALRVVRIFSNSKFNLILTVHESIENVYHTDFSNLIMVWSSGESRNPVRLLSTWSEVSCAEICNDSSEIILCGLRDGSVAMWDLRETYSFCSKLDGHLTHFAATHSITPSWGGADLQSFDLGAVVDVKSFRTIARTITTGDNFKTIQFASLNETGLLTIWTLVETGARNYEISKGVDAKFEYSSPWARVKLTQSAICDLREYIEFGSVRPKSAFERTKSNFQKNVFSDEILKELAESQSEMRLGIQGLRFINLDCGTERIYVGTNRNFIISCSKTLKINRFRKINITGSGFLFPTAIRLLQSEDILAIGLSNGSVMILNCNQEKTYKNRQTKNSENTRRPGTTQSNSNEFDYEIGKSCAIQNIIRNERRSLESRFVEDEFRPNTAALILATQEEGIKPYQVRVFDEQVLLSGSVLRKDLIQSLETSSDGRMLFALSGGNVRAYDFYTENEVQFFVNTSFSRNITDVAASRGIGEEKNVILLDNNNIVEVHLLK